MLNIYQYIKASFPSNSGYCLLLPKPHLAHMPSKKERGQLTEFC